METLTLRSLERPDYTDPRALLRWFCSVFGLTDARGSRDGGIEEQILINLIYAARQGRGISSSELKTKPALPRSTLIYHLNRFMDLGLVVKRGRRYHLRSTDMTKVIEEINYDVNREFMKILDTAREFDKLIDITLSDTKALNKT